MSSSGLPLTSLGSTAAAQRNTQPRTAGGDNSPAVDVVVKEESLNSTTLNSRPLWRGNWSLWWILGSVVSLWFTIAGLVTVAESGKKLGPWFVTHLVTSCLVSWACIWNLFHTPSHGPGYRKAHIRTGWFIQLVGTIAAVTGFVTIFYERRDSMPAGAKIGFAVGGSLQLISQLVGWIMIRPGLFGLSRARDTSQHILWMTFVFFGGCLIPAFMRLPQMITGQIWPVWSMFGWVFPLILGVLAARATRKKSFF